MCTPISNSSDARTCHFPSCVSRYMIQAMQTKTTERLIGHQYMAFIEKLITAGDIHLPIHIISPAGVTGLQNWTMCAINNIED